MVHMKTTLISIALILAVSATHAQNRPASGTIGISASLQSNQTNLKIPIWADDNVVIAPIFGLVHEFDSNTTLNFGINPRFYQDLGDDFATYIGGQGIIQRFSPEFGDESTNFLFGAVGGGEFFLDEHFSIGVEGQLNYLLDDGDNDSISTAAALTGSFYF
jgi:hypothetical protein